MAQRFDPNFAILPYQPIERPLATQQDEQDLRTGRRASRPAGRISMAAVGTPRVIRGPRHLQCVPFAREASGVEIYGNANRWWQLAEGRYRRTQSPTVGSVFVMNGYRTTRRGHVAVVRKLIDSRTMVIDHANWLNDGKIYLSAPVKDVSPNNDWSQVRVWYTPGQQWGSRTYTAKGFIKPNGAQVASAR